MKMQEGFSLNVLRTAARKAAREAEGVSLNCSTNVVLGGQSRRGARADCAAYHGAYSGAGSGEIFVELYSTNIVLGGQSRRGARADCGAHDGAYSGAGS